MSTRRFEYNDDKSSKFWEIAVEGASHTVCYGRIGTDGQKKTKEFDSTEAASKDADKLIGQKTKKGYLEVARGAASAGEGGAAAQLRALLSGLCKSTDDEEVMARLCAAIKTVGDSTLVFDNDGDEWEATYAPGGTVALHEGTPASFSQIAGTVGELLWDGGGPDVGFTISETGEPMADGWLFDEIEGEDAEQVNEAGGAVACFEGGQNGLFFDPTKTLDNGEAALAFIDHECGEWVSVESVMALDYGQILLRMLSDAMTGSDNIPELSF